MAHHNKESLVRQVDAALNSKARFGQSRHEAKKNDTAKDGIYSYSTMRNYKKHCCIFVTYCKKTHGCKTLEQCRPYVDEWLNCRMAACSAATVKLEACALAKLYGCSSTDFVKTPPRHRADITRSRGVKVRDAHFSEKNHQQLVDFCRSTGLRRRELEALRGSDLEFVDGHYCIHVRNGKGGRERYAVITGDVDSVVRLMQAAGDDLVFGKVASAADIHGYRREYATAYYRQVARPLDTLAHDEIYFCRRDKKGIHYDRDAMLTVSRSLGHNRICVIAGHYLDDI